MPLPNASTPCSVGKVVHVILHTMPASKGATMARQPPRFIFHFVPASCPVRNAVEGFCAKVATRRMMRGNFGSLVDLQAAIKLFPSRPQLPSPGRPIPTISSPPADAGTCVRFDSLGSR